MDQFKLFLFGAPRFERAGRPIEISLHKAIGLLVYLAVTKQVYSRDTLATLFWPDSDQTSARASLRRTIYALGKTIGEGVFAFGADTIGLDPQANLWIDLDIFQSLVRDCSSPDPSPDELSPECLARLAEATRLYSDEFLAGFTLRDSPAFDEWQFFQAEQLRQSLAQVLVRLIHTHETSGAFEPAILYARRWLALDPMHEPAHRKLMQLYNGSGQQAAALRQYQQCVKVLDEELHLPPQPETSELYERIRLGREPGPTVKTVERPTTRYVQSGDVHIAYQVLGHGPVDVVFIGGWLSHLEQIWEEPGLAQFFRRLASFSRLILFDKRGVGLSDRVGYPPTLENTMDDVLAVMGAAGCERAVLFGVSEGGTSSALFAATYPQRASGLILYGTLAKGTKSADYPWALTLEQYDKWLDQIMVNWGEALDLEIFAPSRAHDERFSEWWSKSLRLASSPGEVRAVLEVMRDSDVRVALSTIRVPALVIHRTGDRAIYVGSGRFIARQIPGAKYVELPGDDHWWWVGNAQDILNQVEKFLIELKQPGPPDRILATILAIELINGDSPRTVVKYHELVGEQIARFRGNEIRRSDYRLIAMFDGPSRAIQCASAASMSARQIGLEVRAGLHTGECELGRIGVSGVAVQVAINVMEKAASGQVVVSNTIKDLVIGARFMFKEHGQWNFETVPGEWRLFVLDTSE
jgi:DNA-binding SARP family transcriptional activator/pimeloyl-ACP methyl ester carboxylesterase